MNNITNIAIDELQHHPDNPRKDYGDLKELAESIKTSGIMQNLTVVRSDDGTGLYDVIIGNRRLEAAKLAGLDELPCAIVDLSPQEQMATMLAENMQRADLTILEQAQGFQYMLDLGESTKSISEKTGFSTSTVRRRVKLLELDKTELEKAFKRQISLEDIDKINSIDDVKERNKLLDYAGTGNFGWAFKSAQRKQEETILFDKIRKIMSSTNLEEVESNTQWGVKSTKERVGCVSFDKVGKKDDALKSVIDDGIKKYGDKADSYALEYSYLYFLVAKKQSDSKTKTKKDDKEEKERALRSKNAEELKIASENAYQLRYDFIANYPKAQAKKHFKNILKWIAIIGSDVEERDYESLSFCDFDSHLFKELNGLKGESTDELKETVEKAIGCPEKLLLNLVYAALGDDKNRHYFCWGTGYYDIYDDNNFALNDIYKFLEEMGYEMSDTERSLQDGSNPLFYKPEKHNEE